MLSDCAFRAQLASRGQRQLFDYWLQAAGDRAMPARADLDPLKVPRLLPNLGLIDLRQGLDAGLFRLAGTRLRDIYGREITGRRLSDVFSGRRAAYWQRIHARVAEEGLPAHGQVRGPAAGRDHVVLCWLRLPLSDSGGRVDRILCHDAAVANGPAEAPEDFTLFDCSRILPLSVPAPGVPCG